MGNGECRVCFEKIQNRPTLMGCFLDVNWWKKNWQKMAQHAAQLSRAAANNAKKWHFRASFADKTRKYAFFPRRKPTIL